MTLPPITFTVPCVPIAQPRQRQRVVVAKGRSFPHNYTPQKSPVNVFKATVQLAASQAYDGPPLDEPLEMSITFVFGRKKNQIWKTKPMPRLPHVGKPDLDNLLKSLLDALNGTLFVDDARVARLTACKFVASGSEQPHCEVIVWRSNTEAARRSGPKESAGL